MYRFMVMCCLNVSGTHKLQLAVIGKPEKPRSFKGTEALNLPVHYVNQKGTWMNTAIFTEWFEKKCVSQVRDHLKSKGLSGKQCCC